MPRALWYEYIQTLTENDELTGEDTLPAFCRRIGDIFADA